MGRYDKGYNDGDQEYDESSEEGEFQNNNIDDYE